MSSAFLHHVLLVDLTFKQSADGSVPVTVLTDDSAHSWHTILVRESRFRGLLAKSASIGTYTQNRA